MPPGRTRATSHRKKDHIMDANTYVTLKMDIDCGKFDCLKQCCSGSSLASIWRLMRMVSEADLVYLEKMLCGCAVPGTGGVQTGQRQQQSPSLEPINCSDKLTAWACQPTTNAILTAIDVGLTAGAIYAKVPVIRTVLATVSLILSDIKSGCEEISNGHAHNWSDTLVDKLCGLNNWLDAVSKRAGSLLAPIASLITMVRDNLTFLGMVGSACCQKTNVGTSLPDPNTIDMSSGDTGTTTIPNNTTVPTGVLTTNSGFVGSVPQTSSIASTTTYGSRK